MRTSHSKRWVLEGRRRQADQKVRTSRATICVSVFFSASRTTLLMFIGTNVSYLKNAAGFIRRGALGLTTAS